jgi:hypothetical protein
MRLEHDLDASMDIRISVLELLERVIWRAARAANDAFRNLLAIVVRSRVLDPGIDLRSAASISFFLAAPSTIVALSLSIRRVFARPSWGSVHVLPSGSHRIRYCGFLTCQTRAKNIARIRALLAVPLVPIDAIKAANAKPEEPKAREHSCPCCDGRMRIIETFMRGNNQTTARHHCRQRSGSTPHEANTTFHMPSDAHHLCWHSVDGLYTWLATQTARQ